MLSESDMIIIDKPLEVRNELLGLETKEKIIQTALERLSEKIKCKIAAIYLFSKYGLLERVGIHGIDANKNYINDDTFPNESYEIGQGITGLAALPTKNSGYGKTQCAIDPSNEEIEKYSKLEYLKRLGKIKYIISIPLNGQSKTFGVLEVINDSDFSTDDIAWLSAMQSYVATALSNYRRDKQAKILTEIGNLLVDFDDYRLDLENESEKIYKKFVKRLVSPETSFQVGILQIINKDNSLHIKAIESSEEKLLLGRQNGNRKFQEGIIWEVIKSREPKIIEDLEQEKDKFINKEWLEDKGFKSFACFPLVTKKEILGTLSLFVGYKYNFHKSCQSFMESVTSQLASFEANLRLAQLVRASQQGEINYYFPEIQQAVEDTYNNYQQLKKEAETKYTIEISGKNNQIEIQNQQLKKLHEIIANQSHNQIQIIVNEDHK